MITTVECTSIIAVCCVRCAYHVSIYDEKYSNNIIQATPERRTENIMYNIRNSVGINIKKISKQKEKKIIIIWYMFKFLNKKL